MAPPFGYTALDRDDVDDAKRGQPDASLADYSSSRQLRFHASELNTAFVTVLPEWREYVFNVCKGVLPGGRYGLVEHELLEIDARGGLKAQGSFWGTRRKGVFDVRGMLPFGVKERKNKPFANDSVWAPTTKIAVRVPDAALLPRILIMSAGRLPFVGNPKLDDFGAPGYRMAGSDHIDDQLRAMIVSGTVATVLSSLVDPYVRLELDHATLGLTVNGYRSDPADLDRLAAAASAIADALAALCTPMRFQAAFTEARPAPDAHRRPAGYPTARFEWYDAFERVSTELGMVLEEQSDFHRTFPLSPIPGVAAGVVRGVIPGTTTPIRLSWHVHGGRVYSDVRPAACLVAHPAAPALPVGGVLHEPTDLYAEVIDGVAYCWRRERAQTALYSRETMSGAVQTCRDLGLADV